MKTIIVNRYFAKLLLCLLIVFRSTDVFSVNDNLKCSPTEEEPLRVSVSIHINNIYNINTLHETYQVDGYLVYKWLDERMKFTPDCILKDPQIYINDRARAIITEKLWFPCCEFINVQGSRASPNIRIEISSDGNILYTERFFGIFFPT